MFISLLSRKELPGLCKIKDIPAPHIRKAPSGFECILAGNYGELFIYGRQKGLETDSIAEALDGKESFETDCDPLMGFILI